jgi:hypothetical protein
MITMHNAMILSSRAFLTEALPDDFYTLHEKDIDKFLLDNAWTLLKDYTADDLWDLIDAHACDIVATIIDLEKA